MPVAVPDYLRFGMIRAMRLFIAMAKFPAYDRIMSMPMPVMIVIGSEDPVRPPWKNISRAMGDLPAPVRIVLLQGAAHSINFARPRELSHLIRQFVADEEIRMDAANPDGLPVLELRREPGYADLLARLEGAARRDLGDRVELEVDPPDVGGVRGRAGTLLVDYTLPALAVACLESLGARVRRLWE